MTRSRQVSRDRAVIKRGQFGSKHNRKEPFPWFLGGGGLEGTDRRLAELSGESGQCLGHTGGGGTRGKWIWDLFWR